MLGLVIHYLIAFFPNICYKDPNTMADSYPQNTNPADRANVGELELAPKLHQAARLKALGFSHREICEKLGMSESHLSIVSKSPLFISVVKGLNEDLDEATKVAQQTLVEAAPDAAEKLVGIMKETQHEGLKRLVCLDVLKGSGAIKTESTSPQVTVNLTENKMNVILETIQQIRGPNGKSEIKKIE